jgi:hypothetical protein
MGLSAAVMAAATLVSYESNVGKAMSSMPIA